MKRVATATVNLFKLSWVRCLLYACVVGWGEFEQLTETWTQATWHAAGPFDLCRLFGHILFASIFVVIIAFLDQTITGNKQNSPQILNENKTNTSAVSSPSTAGSL